MVGLLVAAAWASLWLSSASGLQFHRWGGSLVWILILALLMPVEKNARWGRRLSAPGSALLTQAAVLLIFP